jgi:hypothetical protein
MLVADYFSVLKCRLILDVAHWLRRWSFWTAICPVSAGGLSPALCQPIFLSSLCLLKVWIEVSSLPFHSSLVHIVPPTPSVACSFSVPCSLFSFCFVLFCFVWGTGSQSVQGAMLIYSNGSCGNSTCNLFVTCWSAGCLLSRFGAVVCQHRNPLVFSVHHGVEKLYRLEVQGVCGKPSRPPKPLGKKWSHCIF